MTKKLPVTILGVEGTLLDHGPNSSYWEAPLDVAVFKQLQAAQKRGSVEVFQKKLPLGFVVVQGCWYNLEAGSMLVQCLFERGDWLYQDVLTRDLVTV